MADDFEGDTEIELPEAAKANGDAVRSHFINQQIIGIIASQMTIIGSMLYCLAASVTIDSEAKEVLLLMAGALSVSLGKAIDWWFSSSEDDEKYLQSAQQDNWSG